MIPWALHLSIDLSNILHGVWTVIRWNRSTLPNRVDVSHVVDWASWLSMHGLDSSIVILSSIGVDYQMSTYVGIPSGVRTVLNMRGLNGPPEKSLLATRLDASFYFLSILLNIFN